MNIKPVCFMLLAACGNTTTGIRMEPPPISVLSQASEDCPPLTDERTLYAHLRAEALAGEYKDQLRTYLEQPEVKNGLEDVGFIYGQVSAPVTDENGQQREYMFRSDCQPR